MATEQKTALITGASSGIGRAFADIFAREGYDLVLIARDKEKLAAAKKEIEEKYLRSVRAISIDLADPASPQKIFSEMESSGIVIDALVNNAGFAEYGAFADADLKKQLAMVDLNIRALTELTHLFLKKMVARNSGKILNVASTAAFQPGPLMAVYYASKSYVLSFTQAVRYEARGHNIAITALCPGPTKTDFIKKQPGFADSHLISNSSLMSADDAASAGYRGLLKNKAAVIPGLRNKLLALASKLGPSSIVIKISAWTLQKNH